MFNNDFFLLIICYNDNRIVGDEMKKRTKYIVLIIFLISLIIPIAISFNKETKTSNEQLKYSDAQNDNVIFEGVGSYAFATAGSNNAYRGPTVEQGYTWITAFPESDKVSYNWETVKEKILTETGLTEITNMSGSYLNISGTMHKAIFSMLASDTINLLGYTGRILIINPNGTYNIINYTGNNWVDSFDITNLIKNSGKGWYYVSFLDAGLIPQCAWSITAVYESSTLPTTYLKFLNINTSLSNGASITIDFNSKFKLQNNFQLIGVITAGGISGFPNYGEITTLMTSQDQAYAILNDKSEYQLYDRGDGHFTNRTNIDFANDIFGTQRNHNIQGGELDIFDETLSSEYFGGKNITGYKFIKTGTNIINISTLGLSQNIVDSNLSVKTKITAATKFQENSSISIKSTINNNLKDGYCYNSYNNIITNSVDNSLSNITNIKAYLNGTTALNATYDSTSRKIVIEEIKELTCSDEIILTFDATVNSNIENSIKNNKYTISSVINNNYSLIDLSELTGDELTKYESLKINEEATDTVTSPRVYKVTVNHYKNGTTTKLADSTTIKIFDGESYTSSSASSLLTNYNVTIPSNASGTATGNITVNYYYTLKQATITIKYLEKGTNKVLSTQETKTLNYTDSYSYTAKDITNYEFSGTSKTVSGTVSGNKEIIFYYTLKQATITIKYLEEGTNKVISSQETKTLNYTDSYSYTAKDITNYEFSGTSKTVSGIVSGNKEIIFYYTRKQATLTVHHYIKGTTESLSASETSTIPWGDTYTTKQATVNPNYEYVSVSGNTTGTVSGNIIVIYYYQKKDSSLETTISKTGPEEITKKDEAVEYKITYTAKVTDYIGEGTITIVDTLPYKINTEISNLDDGTYNEEQNTITWIIPWTDIDSFNNKGETIIEKNITLVYSDIIPTERIMINSVKGSISLDNNSRDIESQTSTNIKIPGKITIHYYLKDTEISVKDSIEETNLVGETYISSAEELEGYILTKPETEEYTFTEEEQIVIYYYERVKVHIKTEVNGNGGTIIGDEDINYGDDSTKDKIVIKPDEGYVLGEVIINGEKIELTEKDKEGLILDNFHELKEDVTITVTFIKKTEENPETGSFISYLVLISIPLSIGIIKYIKNKKEFIKL